MNFDDSYWLPGVIDDDGFSRITVLDLTFTDIK